MSVEQMIVEQDRAGVRKAALVQASTCDGQAVDMPTLESELRREMAVVPEGAR